MRCIASYAIAGNICAHVFCFADESVVKQLEEVLGGKKKECVFSCFVNKIAKNRQNISANTRFLAIVGEILNKFCKIN